MSVIVLTSFAFACGLLCGVIDDWRVWMPLVAAAAIATSVLGRVLGVV